MVLQSETKTGSEIDTGVILIKTTKFTVIACRE